MAIDFQPGLPTGLASQLVVIYRSLATAQPFNLTLGGGLGGFQSWNDAVYGQYWVGPVTEQGTSGCYTWTRPTGISEPVSWVVIQTIGETPSTDQFLAQGADPVSHVIVDSYNTGASPADLILNPPNHRIAVDETGAVNVIGGGGGGGGGGGVVYQAVITNPRYQTRDLPPIAQYSEPTEVWAVTDSQGTPVNLTGKTIRFAAYLTADVGTKQDFVFDNTLSPAFKYETGGNGITVGGAGSNEVILVHDAANTAAPGDYRYFLWNVTDKLVLAKGKCPIEPAVFEV